MPQSKLEKQKTALRNLIYRYKNVESFSIMLSLNPIEKKELLKHEIIILREKHEELGKIFNDEFGFGAW